MNRNPARGCGSKQNNAYYLEGDIGEGDGPLWAWTWVLGDGLDHYIPISRYHIPTRSVVGINPAATLLKESFVGVGHPFQFGPGEEEGYEYFKTKTKDTGSADHVGLQYYTPISFAREVMQYGPSRRVSEKTAILFAGLFQDTGPFPMFFSHSQIPLFSGIFQRDDIMATVDGVLPQIDYEPWLEACWKYGEWGQYAIKNQVEGDKHYLAHILDVLDFIGRLKLKPSLDDDWAKVQKAVKGLRYEEQIFGASWMTRVTYVLPKEDKEAARGNALEKMPTLDILDLEE